MGGLYSARSCRPDFSVPTLRLARRVTRWNAADDAKLLQYLGYIKSTAGARLRSQLDTKDFASAVLRIWPDADLAGDAGVDGQSSGGYWVELASEDGLRSWALHWSYSKQGFTAGHTQEAEIAAMYDAIRNDGLPLATLLEFLLCRPVVVEVLGDNAAANTAAEKGYGPRLRHLHRSKRIHLSYLGEIFGGDNPQANILKVDTAHQKGDLLTKEMEKGRFDECKRMLQIIPATSALDVHVKTLVCLHGVCSPPALALATMAEPPQKELKPGINSFIMDSGSGQHLIRRSAVASEKHITRCDIGVLLQTANGIVRSHLKTRVLVKELNLKVDAWVLDDTPLVLSMGKLVNENQCDFGWNHSTRKASLTHGGKTFNLKTHRGVPLLPAE